MENNTTIPAPTDNREEVIALRKKLIENNTDESILLQLQEYAKDTDWRVRCEVAKCLEYTENDQTDLFSCLFNDSNDFVSTAADKAVERRNSSRKQKEKRIRLDASTLHKIDIIHAKYGDDVGRELRDNIEDAYCQTVGHAAHDIRNIITPIVLETDRIFTTVKNEIPSIKLASVSQSVNHIKENIEILLRVLNDMQAFAKRTPSDRATENLKSLLDMARQQAVEAFSLQTTNPSVVTVTLDIPPELSVYVSRLVIIRAFSNLIKNAMESYLVSRGVAKQGTVEVTAEKRDDRAVIYIRDHGIGMDRKELNRARICLPRGTSKKNTGSGFGLAIAFSKIRDHGGTLEIDSEGPNLGVTATINLPTKGETK